MPLGIIPEPTPSEPDAPGEILPPSSGGGTPVAPGGTVPPGEAGDAVSPGSSVPPADAGDALAPGSVVPPADAGSAVSPGAVTPASPAQPQAAYVAPVQSVNGKTGEVVLNAADVGAETVEGAQAKVNLATIYERLDVTEIFPETSYASLDSTAFFRTVVPDATVDYLNLPIGSSDDVGKPVLVYAQIQQVAVTDPQYLFLVSDVKLGTIAEFRAVEWSGTELIWQYVGHSRDEFAKLAEPNVFSEPVQITSDTVGATTAITGGGTVVLPIYLRGDMWKSVQGGSVVVLPVQPAFPGGYYAQKLGAVLLSSAIFASNIYPEVSRPGSYSIRSVHTGSANTGAFGLWFASACNTPANVFPYPPPCNKRVCVAKVRIPSDANRLGRVYSLMGSFTYSGGHEFSAGQLWLRINGSSNSLEARVCTSYPYTFAATQTTTGSLASPASGTFTAYSLSGSTQNLLIRRTHAGTSLIVEIAVDADTPSWQTVLAMTVGNSTAGAFSSGAPFGLAVEPDGSATGAAASANNSMEVYDLWEAFN